jgi:hypothetical protein
MARAPSPQNLHKILDTKIEKKKKKKNGGNLKIKKKKKKKCVQLKIVFIHK